MASDATTGDSDRPQHPLSPTERTLRKLSWQFSGVWGHRIFWLGVPYLGSYLIRFELLRHELTEGRIRISFGGLIILAYHAIGIFLYFRTHHLKTFLNENKEEADDEDFTRAVKRTDQFNRWFLRPFSWVALILTILGFFAVISIPWGKASIEPPFPEWFYNFYGIDQSRLAVPVPAPTPGPTPTPIQVAASNSSPVPSAKDLSGLWERDNGDIVRIEHTGNHLVAKMETPSAATLRRGRKAGDTAFSGTVEGNTIKGQAFLLFSDSDVQRCSEYGGEQRFDLLLSVSEDRNTLRGTRADFELSVDCTTIALPRRNISYARKNQ